MNATLRTGALVAIVFCIGAGLGAAPKLIQNASRVPDAVTYRPTAVPDRIILTVTRDPAHALAVTWRTDTSVDKAIAQIAPASAHPKFGDRATTLSAISTNLTTDLGEARCHSATFTNLQPDTLYAYRVGDGVNWSEWFHTRTASDRPAPFAFVYFGDAQNEIKSLWSRVIRSAYTEAPQIRLLLHAGDLINTSTSDAQWGEWHQAGGWVNGMVPSLATPGNHEYGKGPLTPNWRAQFTLPENGPAGLEETTYFVDYQGVRFVSLNTEQQIPEQARWLDQVLSDNPNRWTVLIFHRPLFSSAKGRDNPELRASWLPVIDKHRVDLVLQGHDHTYARSHNLRAGVNVRDTDSGTMFVVSVSGPKMYNVERQPWMQRTAEDTQLFQIVRIDGDRLRYEARTATGELYDAFELRKRRGGANRLTERIPNTPERLRTR